MGERWGRLVGALLAVGASGCGPSTRPADTGATEAARGYCEALVQQDWPAAHALLCAESRASCGADAFARLAAAHRRRLGFEPGELVLRSCEEHGDEAVAHVVFRGREAGHDRSFKDALTLRHGASGWGVVLPPRFGQGR
jgi:hypothetical protein